MHRSHRGTLGPYELPGLGHYMNSRFPPKDPYGTPKRSWKAINWVWIPDRGPITMGRGHPVGGAAVSRTS